MRRAARTVEELKNFGKRGAFGVGSQYWLLTHPAYPLGQPSRKNMPNVEPNCRKWFWEQMKLGRLARRLESLVLTIFFRELRNSLNAVKFETERHHLNLTQLIRSDLESPAAAFYTRQLQHRKSPKRPSRRTFKTKQTQETYVNKTREKYEADCMRINSYTAQSSLVQGKDL